jgi:hypothetical protein
MSNHLGINSKLLVENLKRYRNLGKNVNVEGKITTLTKKELNEYLEFVPF